MKTPTIDNSYWITSTEPTAYPPAPSEVYADVAVIGGGIAGMSAAWELTKLGRRVALLEADRIATGVTGYTTAKLTALHGQCYSTIAASAGVQASRLYAQSQQDAVEHVERTAIELGIACDFERRPALTYVQQPDRLGAIKTEVQAATEAGLAAHYVTDCGLPYPIAGAVQIDNQAQFHPRKYTLGLAKAIVEGGSTIYERSRVVALDEGEPCRLTTESGSEISVDDVIVATHYPIFDRGLAFARLRPKRELVVAGTLPEALDPGGIFYTADEGIRSVRTTGLRHQQGTRLLIVTGEKFDPGSDEVIERSDHLTGWVRDRFPQCALAYRWSAQDTYTTDSLPYVGRLHPLARHAYVATGFGGWGMSNGVMAGRLLAGIIDGNPLPWTAIYDPTRLHPVREASALATMHTNVAKHFIGDRIARPDLTSLDDLDRDSGGLTKLDGERCAVYRDKTGHLHAVLAKCTHLGCLVAFNDADRTWECPSRLPLRHRWRGATRPRNTSVATTRPTLAAESSGQLRVSLRCVTRCGRAASTPSRSILFAS